MQHCIYYQILALSQLYHSYLLCLSYHHHILAFRNHFLRHHIMVNLSHGFQVHIIPFHLLVWNCLVYLYVKFSMNLCGSFTLWIKFFLPLLYIINKLLQKICIIFIYIQSKNTQVRFIYKNKNLIG